MAQRVEQPPRLRPRHLRLHATRIGTGLALRAGQAGRGATCARQAARQLRARGRQRPARGAAPGAGVRDAVFDLGQARWVLRRARGGVSIVGPVDRGGRGCGRLHRVRQMVGHRLRGHRDTRRPGGHGPLPVVRPLSQRHRSRSGRDLRMGLGRAPQHRVAHVGVGREDCPGCFARRLHRPVEARSALRRRGRRQLPGMEPRRDRPDHRRSRRSVLRDRRSTAPMPGDGGSRRGTRDHVLHATERGLHPAGSDLASGRGEGTLPAVGGLVDRVPRECSGPSSPAGADDVPGRFTDPFPTARRRHIGPRRGVGTVCRATDARARLPRRSGVRARMAGGSGARAQRE